jgi:hypothetical protein
VKKVDLAARRDNVGYMFLGPIADAGERRVWSLAVEAGGNHGRIDSAQQ